jgi:hypothetical protein
MGTKEIVIGIEKRFANKQIIEKMKKFISSKKGKMKGKVQYVDVKYSSDEINNYYTFKVETELPLDNASEYVRSTIENVVKRAKVLPYLVSSKELTTESNLMRFTQFKSKYIDKIES